MLFDLSMLVCVCVLFSSLASLQGSLLLLLLLLLTFALQVAYFGQPANAYEVCTTALKKKLASKNQVIPGLEDHNPAGVEICLSVECVCVRACVCFPSILSFTLPIFLILFSPFSSLPLSPLSLPFPFPSLTSPLPLQTSLLICWAISSFAISLSNTTKSHESRSGSNEPSRKHLTMLLSHCTPRRPLMEG